MWVFLAVGGVVLWVIKHFKSIKQRADELGGGMGWLKAILEEVKGSFASMGNKALGVLNSVKKKWEDVKNFLKNPIQGVINLFTRGGGDVSAGAGGRSRGGGGRVSRGGARVASHATGLDYVPYDNYLANLHKGEIILTAKASEEYRALGGDKDRVPNMVTNNTTNTQNNNRVLNSSSRLFNNNYYDNQSRNETNSYYSNDNRRVNNSTNTNNYPPININVYGGESSVDTAQEVKRQIERLFRDLRLQTV